MEKVNISQKAGVTVLSFEKNTDICAVNLIDVTDKLVRQGQTKILCDFKNIIMNDDSGMYIILLALRNLRIKGGMLKFCNVSDTVKGFFHKSGLFHFFDLDENEAKALEDFENITRIEKLSQKRKSQRVACSQNATFVVKDGTNKIYNGTVVNISELGAFVKSPSMLRESTIILIDFPLIKEETIRFEAQVAWSSDKKNHPQYHPGMGIKFMNISGEALRALREFVDVNIVKARSALLDELFYKRM